MWRQSGIVGAMSPPVPAQRRHRGRIETLPSGSLRVQVYAGRDPVSKKRHYLTETVPAGPTARKDAERARTRLLGQVDERRNPRTRATVSQLLDRWLSMVELEENTRAGYVSYIEHHIRPVLGELPLSRLNAETLESFYATLRRCREHCTGRGRERSHVCEPLAASTVRQIHSVLRGSLSRAVRWGWLGVNVAEHATPPPAPAPNPEPPAAEEAARIVTEAWKDPDWGMLVWLAMVTGARRGELCALTWERVDFSAGVLAVRTSIAQRNGHTWEKETKTHQQRRITLDDQTLALFRAYRRRRVELATALGIELTPTSRVFSLSPDGSTWINPDTVTRRYARMCARLGWDMHLHQLRHYSGTELVAAGVDVRTVAGRLGHSGGGTTTLKVYSAWRSEADQRAAGTLAGRMPALPFDVDQDGAFVVPAPPVTEDSAPYLRIAADLRGAITCGALRPGDPLPTLVELAGRYGVAESTAHRAIAELTAAGLVQVSRGQRAKVAPPEVA
jgi:integrase